MWVGPLLPRILRQFLGLLAARARERTNHIRHMVCRHNNTWELSPRPKHPRCQKLSFVLFWNMTPMNMRPKQPSWESQQQGQRDPSLERPPLPSAFKPHPPALVLPCTVANQRGPPRVIGVELGVGSGGCACAGLPSYICTYRAPAVLGGAMDPIRGQNPAPAEFGNTGSSGLRGCPNLEIDGVMVGGGVCHCVVSAAAPKAGHYFSWPLGTSTHPHHHTKTYTRAGRLFWFLRTNDSPAPTRIMAFWPTQPVHIQHISHQFYLAR